MPAGRLRVALLSPYSLTIPGGVQGQVLGLARELRRCGHEARVIGPCDGPPPEPFVTTVGNSLPTAANGSIAPLAPDPAAVLRVVHVLRDEGFDIVHLHEPLAPGITLATLSLRPAPILATFHAAGDSTGYRVFNAVARQLAQHIDLRVAVSPDAAELAGRYLGGHYEVLFNGVELDRFATAPAHPGGERAIFFCGRHEPRKGLAVLLDAMSRLPGDVTAWIGSDGPETAALRQAHADDGRVEWLGRLSDEEKASRMRGARVFCAPSLRGESFGVVLLEAMAAGVPVVASDLDGYRFVATHDREALLVAPGDSQALAAAVGRVMDDDALAARLVADGRARAQNLSMARLAELYLHRYRQLIEASPGDSWSGGRGRGARMLSALRGAPDRSAANG